MQPNLATCFQDSNLFMDTMECVAVLVSGISSTVRGHPSEHLLMHGTRHCSKSYTCKAYKTWEQWNSRPVSIITSLWHPKVHTMGHYAPLIKFGYFKKDHTSSIITHWTSRVHVIKASKLSSHCSYTMRQELGRSLGTADIILLKSVYSDWDTWQSQKHVR